MKLRFRKNSLRLRINQRELKAVATGSVLEEQVHFPGGVTLTYILESAPGSVPSARFEGGAIRVSAPATQVARWADSDDIGLYFELGAKADSLKIAIEKDLVCLDGPEEEQDNEAFPRLEPSRC